MPLGRPDFWYGQVLLFEEEPTDGRTDAGPTSNWAYDHKGNPDIHHVAYTDAKADARVLIHKNIVDAHHARYADSEADARIALHTAIATAHHVRYADSEADARIALHTAVAAAHHAKYTNAEAQAACWPVFIDRGDSSKSDKTTTDFTKDGTWHNLDLSAIVPAGAKAVLVKIIVQTTTVPLTFSLREDGNIQIFNTSSLNTQVVNVPLKADLVVSISTARFVEYFADAGTWTVLTMTVRGWWL